MKEHFKTFKEYYKEKRAKKLDYFVPLLKKIGAIHKSDGIYQFKDYFCYPTKGFAMHKKTYKKKNLKKFLLNINKK